MTRIDPARLSSLYRAEEAAPSRFRELYGLYASNPGYFEYFDIEPSEERLYRDMTMRPDGCIEEQKHFIAYLDRETGRPAALLDLIEGYPEEDICYIGLFMVDAALSGRGTGTAIITELCAELKSLGFAEIRLAYGREYMPGKAFWTKNGFVPFREAELEEYGKLFVARREL